MSVNKDKELSGQCKLLDETKKIVGKRQNCSRLDVSKWNKVDVASSRVPEIIDGPLHNNDNQEYKKFPSSCVTLRKRNGRKFGDNVTNVNIEVSRANNINSEKAAIKSKTRLNDSYVTGLDKHILKTSTPLSVGKISCRLNRNSQHLGPDPPNFSKFISPLCQKSIQIETYSEKSHLNSAIEEDDEKSSDNGAKQRKLRCRDKHKVRAKPCKTCSKVSKTMEEHCPSAKESTLHDLTPDNLDVKEYQLFETCSADESEAKETVPEVLIKTKRKAVMKKFSKIEGLVDHSYISDSESCSRSRNGKPKKSHTRPKKTAIPKNSNNDKVQKEIMKIQEMEDIFNNYSLTIE